MDMRRQEPLVTRGVEWGWMQVQAVVSYAATTEWQPEILCEHSQRGPSAFPECLEGKANLFCMIWMICNVRPALMFG